MPTFYQPHPGYRGSLKRLPAALVGVLAHLAGQQAPIETVMELLSHAVKACPEFTAPTYLTVAGDGILLREGTHHVHGVEHVWCLIKFKD